MSSAAASRSDFQTLLDRLIAEGWDETGAERAGDMRFFEHPSLPEAPFLFFDALDGKSPHIEGFAGISMRPWLTFRKIDPAADGVIAGTMSFQGAQEDFALPLASLTNWIRTHSTIWPQVLFSRGLESRGHNEGDRPRAIQDDTIPFDDAAETNPGPEFSHIADCIVRLIDQVVARETTTPAKRDSALLTLGLFGPWGAGKTTLIEALSPRLNKSKYLCFRLNPWKWDGKAELHEFVRRAVLLQFKSAGVPVTGRLFLRGRIFLRRYGAVIWLLLLAVVALGLPLLRYGIGWLGPFLDEFGSALVQGRAKAYLEGAFGILAFGLVPVVWKQVGSWLKNWIGNRLSGRKAQELGVTGLATAYQDLAALSGFLGKSKPLVFFIDDLDRCSPERVAEFVESVHSLTAAGCITFLACDEDYVFAALNAKFEKIVANHPDGRAFGRRFLEKIVQIPYRLPSASRSAIYDLKLAEASQYFGTPALRMASASTDFATATELGMKQAYDPAFDQNHTPSIDDTKLSQIIGELLEGMIEELGLNIREIKSIANTVKLYVAISRTLRDDRARRIAAFIIANRIDPEWLDLTYSKQAQDNTKIGRLPEVSQKLSDILGDGEFGELYRLIGRHPKIHRQRATT